MNRIIVIILIVGAFILTGFLAWFFITNGLFGDNIDIDPDNGVVQSGINEDVEVSDIKILVLQIIEDSRCPVDVICIQSGTIRVEAQITSGSDEVTEIFTLDKQLTVGSKKIELIRVKPEASTKNTSLDVADYQFIWQVDSIE